MSLTPSLEAPSKVVRFGMFEADLGASELRKRGRRLKLQEQSLTLLKILLEQHGNLVTRDELRQRLWDPDTFVDFDHSLNTAIMRLREALGDSSNHPIFIETIPRKGYRFIAPVHDAERLSPPTLAPPALVPISDQPSPDQPSPDRTSPDQPSQDQPSFTIEAYATEAPSATQAVVASLQATANTRFHRQVSLGPAILITLAALALAVVATRMLPGWVAPPVHQIGSIVVLPMQNLSGDRNQDYFADGMTDELIANLARISSLRVISRITAMEYKNTHESLEKIAHDLNVDAVVEGTVLRAGDRVRITAELVQVSTDRHLWADTYESPLGDVLALQNQVASAIVSQIRIKLTPEDKQHLASTRSVNPDAYEDYLKGRYYWGKRSENGLDTAIHYFSSATEKDPQYALAYAGLADCYGILGAAIVGTVPTSEVASKAETAALRAVELDPSLAETQTALATAEFNYKWNWAAADAGFRRAIQLNPSYATAHQRYSLYLIAMGRPQESLAEMNRARSLDPLSLSVNFSLGWRLYMAGQYDQAIVQLVNTIEMDPTYLLAHIILGQSYEQKGQYVQAIAELQKAGAMSPGNPTVIAALGHVYAVSGNRVEALRSLDQLKAEARQRYVSPFYMALVYTGLGDRENAIRWLGGAFEDRSNNMIFLDVVPQFKDLRSDPAFKDLLRRIGLHPGAPENA